MEIVDGSNLYRIGLMIALANFIMTWGVALYMYISNKNKVTNERINALEEDVKGQIESLRSTADARGDDHNARINRLEVSVKGAPTHKDLSAIHEKVNTVSEGVSQIKGEMPGIRNMLNVIHNHLLANNK